MSLPDADRSFAGSIPQLYEGYLVPLIFEPYARDISTRVVARKPSRVLEIAAGTGVVTRHLASELPPTTSIVATDLNPPMIQHAASVGTSRPVEWKQADAMQLPFPDAAFDVVVCQYGVMFFPDKAKAYAEVRRLLRPGGAFIFNVWDRIESNEFAEVVHNALKPLFPTNPIEFMARTPHGYYDHASIAADLAAGGFSSKPSFTTLSFRSRADSARTVAIAYCQGTPTRNQIEARDPALLMPSTDAAEKFLKQRFGFGVVDGKIQAHVVVVER